MEKCLLDAPATAMLQASLLSREGKPREADAALAALAAGGQPGRVAEAHLMRAQLAAAGGDGATALQHLSVSVLCCAVHAGRLQGSCLACQQRGRKMTHSQRVVL